MFKDTVIVAIGTAVSRLTGLLRVVVFGVIIGQTALADAFDGANNSPNSIYELLVGGLLAASLVPLFTRFAEDDDQEATVRERLAVYHRQTEPMMGYYDARGLLRRVNGEANTRQVTDRILAVVRGN